MSEVLNWVLSARDARHGQELRLTPQSPLPPNPERGAHGVAPIRLWVDTTRRFQRLEGFGGAFTEAAATTWLKLSEAQQQRLLREYFDPVEGHGYLMCRVHMNSCDFALGNYAHAEEPGDFGLASFTIDRDREALLPMIKAAQTAAGRALKLLVSPWSPPAWMKDSGRMNDGGRLKPECAAAWAQCYVKFIQAYEAEGVPVWGVSVQNEPEARQRWDSCLYSAEEERDFVRDHLGPALHAAGLARVRIVVWDHNRDAMVERASVMYGDPEAAKHVWGTGFHWYVEDHFEHVQLVHDAWPDKQLLFTEGCQEGGPHWGRWELAERYARSIVNDLNRWTVGWIDWNLLLDEQGGPNHVGNFCSAPFLAVPDEDGLHAQSSFAALGHFARFIQPGAQRVLAAATREALECTAFVNPDGRVAVVVLNRSDHDIAFSLAIDGAPHTADLPAHSIATYWR
ncbi:glycoside hydrolase family 30 beta sandwich domain-containing protein [Inhella sp.]|uniref:glycoside hydrolase family 30 protein n=1 Tax=Inhella sp. TaxID=1921806 RepID=UPI0035AE6A52